MSRTIRKRKEKDHWDRHEFVEGWFKLEHPHEEYYTYRPYTRKGEPREPTVAVKVHGWPYNDIDRMLKKYQTPNVEQAMARAFYRYHCKGMGSWKKPWVRSMIEKRCRATTRRCLHQIMSGDQDVVVPDRLPIMHMAWYMD